MSRASDPGRVLTLLAIACLLAPAMAGAQAGPGEATAAEIATVPPTRPPWVPFCGDAIDLLSRAGPLVPVVDGIYGEPAYLLHEPGDSPLPTALRDGEPGAAVHLWTDDPWTWSLAGVTLAGVATNSDPWGSGAPRVRLSSAEPDTDGARLDTAFFKGDHDTYLRRLSLVTPQAPWVLRFDFDELIDQLPENRPLTGSAEGKTRLARSEMQRRFDDGSSLTLTAERDRRHITKIPLRGLDHQELWGDRVALVWRQPLAGGELRTDLWNRSIDVVRIRGAADRKLELTREGARTRVDHGAWRLEARAATWRLDDDAAGLNAWAGADTLPVRDFGHEAAVSAGWEPGAGLSATAVGRWRERAGWSPHLSLNWRPGASPFALSVSRGGRAPRLDETLTPDLAIAGVDSIVTLPTRDLGWEKLDEARLGCATRLLGNELVLDGAWRRLRDGVGWEPTAPGATAGRWANDVSLDGWTAALSLRRAQRFAGWLRCEATLAWRDWTVDAGRPVGLPPKRSSVVNVFWEHHWFREDGILEIGWVLERRGEMSHPWFPDGDVAIPARTLQHLIFGFRLVGADLGAELRNLTGVRDAISPDADAVGREFRWRLQWTLRR